jgi:hypothetical protein
MILHLFLFALAYSSTPYRPLPAVEPAVSPKPASIAPKAACLEEKRVNQKIAAGASTSEGIASLPFAMGRRFKTLDEYLAHLRCRAGPIDLPWWKEVRPGVYQHMTTKPGAPREIATRAELMKRFGFSS